MNQDAKVVRMVGKRVLVAVDGNANSTQPLAPCCIVASVEMEAGNPRGFDLKPGEVVEISDGLGKMILAGSSYVLFPAVLFAVASLIPVPWLGPAGAALGLAVATVFFRRQRLGQYPIIVGQRATIDRAELYEL